MNVFIIHYVGETAGIWLLNTT